MTGYLRPGLSSVYHWTDGNEVASIKLDAEAGRLHLSYCVCVGDKKMEGRGRDRPYRPGTLPVRGSRSESLEDWVDRNNPVRAIDAFVDKLELSALGFDGVAPEVTDRPAYHPSVLLKLYIHGYLVRVQSSRRLEREAARNVEAMWLTCRLVPDHKTIADFRKDNGPAIKQVCAQFVELCR